MLLMPQAGFSLIACPASRKCYLQRFGAGKEAPMESERNDLVSLFPNVASQIRNTLASLHLATAQLVPASAREQDPALDAQAALVDQNYYRLLRLVNNLSLAAHLAEEHSLTLQDRDLVSLTGSLCEKAASLAAHLNLKFRFVCAKEHLICAIAPDALENILGHLLSNAFKFTPAGGTVTVELRLHANRVLISVEDTGSGIPEEILETLFDRYLHAGQLTPPPHGLGLGLSLCRRLAEELGGTLMAESREGKGSRFTLSLPNRQLGTDVSDIAFDYSGGFNKTLLALADAMPANAFLIRNQN